MTPPSICAACGAPATGPFCAACGARTRASRRSRDRQAWQAAGGFAVLVIALLVFTLRRERSGAAAVAAADAPVAGAAGVPPDLSSMTPRERFDRLYRRVLGAAEGGDSGTVARFTPMVFAAYVQLDTVDADARYHAAVLRLHVLGDSAGALALADTILLTNPRHLFGFLIRGTTGQLAGNPALLRQARRDLVDAWEQEMKVGRPEYRDHQAMLDQFHAAALAAGRP